MPARRGVHAAFLDEAPVEQVADGAVGAALLHVEEPGQAALALEVVAPGVAEAEDARVDEQGKAGEAQVRHHEVPYRRELARGGAVAPPSGLRPPSALLPSGRADDAVALDPRDELVV